MTNKLQQLLLSTLNLFISKVFGSARQVQPSDSQQLAASRLIIVSNRLATTVLEKEDGSLSYAPSSGGLATGLMSYLEHVKNKEHLWVGWIGSSISEKNKAAVQNELLKKYQELPIFLNDEHMEKFYNGFCNKTIWPLFHYFPALTEYNREYWDSYIEINRTYFEVLKDKINKNDIVWIHDYHLMLLPAMLRAAFPKIKIGFFLHIPFPFYEIFRLLPKKWGEEILYGLLGSDLIGFHTHNYVQYFLGCVLRILGIEHTTGKINYENRNITAEALPMGINYAKFNEFAKKEESVNKAKEIKTRLGDRKIILSLDRLDYSKGINKRLFGYELFLEQNPEWRNKVTFMAYIIPSRIDVDSYQQMKKQLDEEIGRINGKFSVMDWAPITYQFNTVPFEELVPLYNAADIALVTPMRDGMNLIAKEYIASKSESDGVLILSEMAGAAKELTEALIINPNNIEEIAQAIKEALEMPKDEQIRRNIFMQNRIKRYDINRWGDDIVEKISSSANEELFPTKLLNNERIRDLLQEYQINSKRIIFLDYDGTLIPFKQDPLLAKPTEELLALLKDLSASSTVVLISGRGKNILDLWFGHLTNVTLVAEHGAWIRKPFKEWTTIGDLANSWKKQILPILEKYSDSVPGSFVEEKDYSLAWHYRMADPEQSSQFKKELLDDLIHFTANIDVSVIQGNKVVEVRNSLINKGSSVHDLLGRKNYSFTMGIGDDETDEDMFRALPKNSYSIKVGLKNTEANYFVNSYKDVLSILKKLTNK